jgi:hypothetical protein
MAIRKLPQKPNENTNSQKRNCKQQNYNNNEGKVKDQGEVKDKSKVQPRTRVNVPEEE